MKCKYTYNIYIYININIKGVKQHREVEGGEVDALQPEEVAHERLHRAL